MRALPADIIYVGNFGKPYVINESIPLKQNVTLVGYKGTPTIRSLGSTVAAILFVYSYAQPKVVSLSMTNLIFDGIGAVEQLSGQYRSQIQVRIYNCSFENVRKTVIGSYNHQCELCSMHINISKSLFNRCSYVVHIEQFVMINLVLDINESSIKGFQPRKYEGISISGKSISRWQNVKVCIVKTNFTHLSRCLFIRGKRATIRVHRSTFTDCGFPDRNPISASARVFHVISGSVLLSNSTFIKNRNSAVWLDSSSAHIKTCQFLNNDGSPFVQFQSRTTVTECYFERNKGSSGGAICSIESKCSITGSRFVENYASHYGGTIYHRTRGYCRRHNCDLYVENCFIIYPKQPPRYDSISEVLYLKPNGDHVIKNTAIYSADRFSSHQCHRTLFKEIPVKKIDNVTVHCPRGWNISIYEYHAINSNLATGVSCQSCPPNHYSLHSGKVLYLKNYNKGYKTDPIKCFRCPYGGRCNNGILTPQDNFWGIQIKSQCAVKFVRCPMNYCCQGKQCQDVNSCNSNRVGTLCGRCKAGYSEDSLTSDCLPNTECYKIWFWVIFSSSSVLYTISFMYMKEIVHCLKKLFGVRKAVQRDRKYCSLQAEEYDFEAIVALSSDAIARSSTNKEAQEVRDKAYLSGFIKIAFFFYQTQSLLNMSFGSKQRVTGTLGAFREVISDIFNLKINAVYHNRTSLCPFTGLQPVTKELLKLLFIICIVVLFGITGLIYEIYKLKIKDKNNKQAGSHFRMRILCSWIQILLLGYARLTKSVMKLLRCKSLYNFGYLLFIDGNITCFTWWQCVFFALLAVWIIPFPLALYLASRQLIKRQLSINIFFLGLAIPLPFIVYCFINACCGPSKQNCQFSTRSQESGNEYLLISYQYPADVKAVLDVLSGPFRYTTEHSTTRKTSLIWEPVLILRRLILICVYTFAFNPVIQLYVMLLLLLVFLIHHLFVMPYSSRILNIAETVSLLTLCVLCSMSLMPAYNYAYPLTNAENFKDPLHIFSYIETFCVTVVPSVIAIALCIMILIRILRLLWLALKHLIMLARSIYRRVICRD